MGLSRKKKLAVNSITGLFQQVIAIVCAFIVPRLILRYFGSEVNGLIQSVSQFLSLISLLESGVGQVISANLYEPLAKNDTKKISEIVKASQKFFYTIGIVFAGFTVLLAVIYPYIINSQFDYFYAFFLVLILAMNNFAQYFIGWPYLILIDADQCLYFTKALSIVTVTFSTFVSVVLIKLGFGIHIIKLSVALIYLFQPICMKMYADHKYKIDHNIRVKSDPIKQKWNGLAQHIAFIVATRTDAVVLTFFSSLSNVSIYSVYNMVLVGISGLLSAMTGSIGPFLGNMIANDEIEKLSNSFEYIEWILHNVVVFLYTAAALLIVPFISVYTAGVNDADYIVPVFAFVLTLAYALRELRTPYSSLVFAAGHFKQTQNSSILEALINVVVSIGAVFRFGLVGVAVGTACAMAYRTLYLVIYLSKNIIYRRPSFFCRHLLVDIVAVALSFLLSHSMIHICGNYFEWIRLSIQISAIIICILIIINFVFYPKQVKKTAMMFRRR